MIINFIVPCPGNSGGMHVIYKYAEELQKRGYNVNIYYPLIPYNYEKNNGKIMNNLYTIIKTIWFIVKFVLLKYEKKFNSNISWKHVLKINDFFVSNADIVIATAWVTANDVTKLNNEKGDKYYFVQDYEIWDNKDLGMQTYNLPLKKIVISSWIKDQILKQGVNDKIKLLYNGIDTNIFNYDRKFEDKENINCLILYHNLEKKGVKYGIKAFEKALNRTSKKLSLTMFGLKKSSNLPDYIKFKENPSKNEIVELYKNCDIFIFPSIEEGWGLTVVEAMLTKCSVVGTNTGCLIDIGKDCENALICEPKNIEKMADDIVLLSENFELRKTIGENAFNSVKDNSWEKSVDNLIEILDKEW